MAMSMEKRKVIQENFTKITDNIADADSVVSNLLSAGVITTHMNEEIMAKRTKSNKVREILTLLPKRGEAAFDKFYKALIDAEEYIAAELIEAHVTDRSLIPSRVVNIPVPVDELPEVFPPDNEEEEITVVPCLNTDAVMTENYRKSLDDNNSEVYKNTKNGLCLLFYNESFNKIKGFNDLDWEKDVGGLMSLFEKLGFQVDLHPNLTITRNKSKLDTYRKDDKLMKRIDCLVVFVLTHGQSGLVYGTDGDSMTVQSIIEYFYPASCPDLGSKPKLFFIQAASIGRETRTDSVDGGPEQTEISIKTALAELNLEPSEASDAVAERKIPSRGDTFVCFSATSDKVKPNEDDSGSMFIQALIYAYKKYSYSSDLFTLTQKMNDLIKKGEQKHGYPATGGSHFKTSLVKSLYFFPGKS